MLRAWQMAWNWSYNPMSHTHYTHPQKLQRSSSWLSSDELLRRALPTHMQRDGTLQGTGLHLRCLAAPQTGCTHCSRCSSCCQVAGVPPGTSVILSVCWEQSREKRGNVRSLLQNSFLLFSEGSNVVEPPHRLFPKDTRLGDRLVLWRCTFGLR